MNVSLSRFPLHRVHTGEEEERTGAPPPGETAVPSAHLQLPDRPQKACGCRGGTVAKGLWLPRRLELLFRGGNLRLVVLRIYWLELLLRGGNLRLIGAALWYKSAERRNLS